jgi:hypothetical protein
MEEPSVRVQWALIAFAAVFGVGFGIWSIVSGVWYLFAALMILTVLCGAYGWKSGLPLYPGAPSAIR